MLSECVMLSVIYAKRRNKPIMMSVVMLNVVVPVFDNTMHICELFLTLFYVRF
jgi:hypothetical protein